jgi:hypothetical protein
MKRLRHPIRAIREPFGTAGLVVACIALIAALGGTALAATKLNSTQKKEVEKIAKKFAGKPGAAGVPGPAGSPGAAGANGKDGTNGTNGKDGKDGTNGTPGAAGKSPEIVLSGAGLCSGKGGVVYEVEGSNEEAEICNGKEGKDGKEGSPWTAGGTLPPGATETGYWSFSAPPAKVKVDVEGTTQEIALTPAQGIYAAISFPIKLPFALKAAHVHFGEPGSGGAFDPAGACPGVTFAPEAKPGELCVYEGWSPNAAFSAINKLGTSAPGASVAGAIIRFAPAATEPNEGVGSFAVTGCEEQPGTSECKP